MAADLRIGDIVLHFADDKHPKMFMQVIGFTKDGRVITRYLHTHFKGVKLHSRRTYTNPSGSLCRPAEFGIKNTEVTPEDFEMVRLWNYYHKVGDRVRLLGADGGGLVTTTRSAAWLVGGTRPGVLVDGKGGAWELSMIEPLPSIT